MGKTPVVIVAVFLRQFGDVSHPRITVLLPLSENSFVI